jgi:hypothetical protein
MHSSPPSPGRPFESTRPRYVEARLQSEGAVIALRAQRVLPFAAFALLAGCLSGAQAPVPSNVVPQSQTESQAQAARAVLAHANASSCYVFYMSDSVGGAMTMYDGVTHQQTTRIKSSHLYKWGVAANATTIFAATDSDGIDEYAPCGTTILKTLQGKGKGGPSGGVAMGVAALDDGTVFAGEYPNNLIDVFDPTGTDTVYKEPNLATVFYLATDATGDVFVDGFANSSKTEVDECNQTFSTCTVMSAVKQPGFPGGLAVDAAQNLWLNDETGKIYEYTYVSGYVQQAKGSPFNYHKAALHNVFGGIAFDRREQKLWASDIFSCNNLSCSKAQSITNPIGKFGPMTKPNWTNAQSLGIAVFPPGKN